LLLKPRLVCRSSVEHHRLVGGVTHAPEVTGQSMIFDKVIFDKVMDDVQAYSEFGMGAGIRQRPRAVPRE